MSSSRIEYSEKYADEENEYRWVMGLYKIAVLRTRGEGGGGREMERRIRGQVF